MFPYKFGASQPTFPKGIPEIGKFKSISIVKAPPFITRDLTGFHTKMYGNDIHSNCTAAGVINAINAFIAKDGTSSFINASTDDVLKFYSKSTGYDPNNPATDQGGDPTQVLLCAARTGFRAGDWDYFPVFGVTDPGDRNSVANIINTMGSLYGAFALSKSDEQAVMNGEVLDITNPGDQTLWSAGGHLANPYAYDGLGDDDLVHVITWGGFISVTWRWIHSRLVGAYGLLWHQLMGAGHTNTDWENLRALSNSFMTTQG